MRKRWRWRRPSACVLPVLLAASVVTPLCHADGLVVDKIYHPYVDALTTEVEWRSVFQQAQPGLTNKAQVHQLSLGRALGARTFVEAYLVGAKDRARGFETEAWELELKRQLTEQGEYAVDWGLVVEYEHARQASVQEVAVGLLAEKEFATWSGTANLFLIREWGKALRAEYETAFNLQARYRYSAQFEPGLEFYAGQNTRALGPVVQGTFKLGVRKNLHWESGLIFGLDTVSATRTWRFLLEYEF